MLKFLSKRYVDLTVGEVFGGSMIAGGAVLVLEWLTLGNGCEKIGYVVNGVKRKIEDVIESEKEKKKEKEHKLIAF